MKIYHKVRYPNGRRHIYLFGIKIFSYRRAKKYAHTPPPQIINENMANIIAQNIHMQDGYDDFSYQYLKHYFQNRNVLKNEANTMTWLIAISVLISEKQYVQATYLLNTYIKRFGYTDVVLFEKICNFLPQISMNTPETDSVLKTYEKISQVQSQHRFENMVKAAKSIAIVGRSPILTGAGLGATIDAHDLVIRFNAASVSDEFVNDFGKKTDVMVVNCWIKNDTDAMCLYKDARTFGAFQIVLDAIQEDPSENIDFLPYGLKHEICQESGLNDPTSGAIMIYWVRKILGDLSNVDIYGFAFQDPERQLTHYDANHVINTDNHDMFSEILYLTNLTSQRRS